MVSTSMAFDHDIIHRHRRRKRWHLQQRPFVSREVMREGIRLGPSACRFIRMRRMRIRDWVRAQDMIIPVAVTLQEMKCRRRLPCWNRERKLWHFLPVWQRSPH